MKDILFEDVVRYLLKNRIENIEVSLDNPKLHDSVIQLFKEKKQTYEMMLRILERG